MESRVRSVHPGLAPPPPQTGLLGAITTNEREREMQGIQKLQGSDQMIQRGGLDPMMIDDPP